MILIKNARLINPKNKIDMICDISISNNVIEEIAPNIPANTKKYSQIIDASNKIVSPGLIDIHVHFRDPGFTHKEDIQTGANAAKRGGFTTVICMANTFPAIDNEETLKYVLAQGKKTGINVLSCAAISKKIKGEELVDLKHLKECGAIGFTDDGIPLMNQTLVRLAMQEVKKLDLPLSLHEEDKNFVIDAGVNAGKIANELGIEGAYALAEDSLVARDCMIALETGATINIQHISSKNSVKLVKLAKELGANVYAEATPHHFTLTEDDILKYGTLAKMNPPLRTNDDRLAIIEGLKDGSIDIIATDHAPHTNEEKNVEFTKAPSGIIGLETALALGITHLVRKGHLTLNELIEKMTINPAMLYKLDSGSIEIGKTADLVIFSPDKSYLVKDYDSKSANTPFTGETLYGVIEYTICNGKIVYSLN
jgi:dihydroorotase, multifunctional complex type